MSSGDNTSLTNNGSFDFWGGGWVSLEDRPGITGRLLQQKARQVYMLPGKENMTLPWFDDEGTPLWSRHVMNRDTQEDTREKYVTSLVESGWLLGQRGEIVYVLGEPYQSNSEPSRNRFLIVCGAHLIEAFYTAIKRFDVEENAQLKITLQYGVPDCTEINAKAPDDAIRYFVDLGNALNNFASSTSFLQVYKKVHLVSAGWEKKKKEQKVEQKLATEDKPRPRPPDASDSESIGEVWVENRCLDDEEVKAEKVEKERVITWWDWRPLEGAAKGLRKWWNWKHLESAMLRAAKKTKENDAYLARPS